MLVKKILIIITMMIVITVSAFADHPKGLGIGLVGGYYGGWQNKGYAHYGLSLKVPKVPIFWGINLHITDSVFSLGVTGDKYFVDSKLLSEIKLNWYLGLGAYGGISFSEEPSFTVGLRVPIGLSWQPVPIFELFLDIAPSLGFTINPIHFPSGGFPIEFGFRLWV